VEKDVEEGTEEEKEDVVGKVAGEAVRLVCTFLVSYSIMMSMSNLFGGDVFPFAIELIS
jgi:hypothetical protein